MMAEKCRFRVVLMLLSVLMLLLPGCGDDSKSGAEAPVDPTDPVVTVEYFTVGAERAFVKTDGNDNILITSTALDKNRVPVKDAMIFFSTTGGQLSASSVKTNEEGRAEIRLTAGLFEKTNQVVTVTADAGNGKQASLPIQMIGSTVSMNMQNTTLQTEETRSVSLEVKDGGGNPVGDTEIVLEGEGVTFVAAEGWSFSSGPSETSPGHFEARMRSNISGEAKFVVKGGMSAVKGFVSAKALGAEAKTTVDVVVAADAMKIESPSGTSITESMDPITGEVVKVVVKTPYASTVSFHTSLGGWGGLGGPQRVDVTPTEGTAKLTLYSNIAGMATVTVTSRDGDNNERRSSIMIAVTAKASQAYTVDLQASRDRLPPSVGEDLKNTAILYATVKNSSGQVVSGAPVWFSLEDTTGGGEYIDPAVVYTDAHGKAETTFTSGSLVSDTKGVAVVAEVKRSNDTFHRAEQRLVISGEAGSVSIGRALVSKESGDTAYEKPMSVMVSDAKGNPVAGQKVFLSVWPKNYYTGYGSDEGCITDIIAPFLKSHFPNEDSNRNGILDSGEDGEGEQERHPMHGNGQLDPAASAAGTIPVSVVTNENGIVEFSYIYQKHYSCWLDVEISASTTVYGTEANSSIVFRLPYLEKDKKYIPNSPFNGY